MRSGGAVRGAGVCCIGTLTKANPADHAAHEAMLFGHRQEDLQGAAADQAEIACVERDLSVGEGAKEPVEQSGRCPLEPTFTAPAFAQAEDDVGAPIHQLHHSARPSSGGSCRSASMIRMRSPEHMKIPAVNAIWLAVVARQPQRPPHSGPGRAVRRSTIIGQVSACTLLCHAEPAGCRPCPPLLARRRRCNAFVQPSSSCFTRYIEISPNSSEISPNLSGGSDQSIWLLNCCSNRLPGSSPARTTI